MLAENAIQPPVVTEASDRMTFFRQSGWMMIAVVGSGFFASAVHILSKWVSDAEYSAAGTMIQLIGQMQIPTLGLQLVFAHQTSSAVTVEQRRRLVGTFKAVMRWTFYLWLVIALYVLVDHTRLQAQLRLSNPWTLWFTLLCGLMMLWTPVLNGLLQGRQNFLWMGWVAIINSAGRVLMAAVIVLCFHGQAAGIVAGILLGLAMGVAIAFWQNWDLWNEPSEKFDAWAWLRHVTPLTLTNGVGYFLQTEDGVMAPVYLGAGGAAAPYIFGGTLARAIPLATGPLAAVMFPKLVHRKARSQTGGPNLLGLTLLGTLILGCTAAVTLSFVAPFLIKLASKAEYVSIVPLIPLFAWVMVPLAMGNVLLNSLNAHSYFKPAPALLVLAVGYWIALLNFHASFKMVVETLGVFNLLYLGVCAFFTWRQLRAERRAAPAAAVRG